MNDKVFPRDAILGILRMQTAPIRFCELREKILPVFYAGLLQTKSCDLESIIHTVMQTLIPMEVERIYYAGIPFYVLRN